MQPIGPPERRQVFYEDGSDERFKLYPTVWIKTDQDGIPLQWYESNPAECGGKVRGQWVEI